MSTRGILGFRIAGKQTLIANHWDSYLDGLGLGILQFLERHRDELPALEEYLSERIVSAEDAGEDDSWEQPLSTLQTRIDEGRDFRNGGEIDKFSTSCFCEYAYVVDFDTLRMEVYVWNGSLYGDRDGRPRKDDPSRVVGQLLMTEQDLKPLIKGKRTPVQTLRAMTRKFNAKQALLKRVRDL